MGRLPRKLGGEWEASLFERDLKCRVTAWRRTGGAGRSWPRAPERVAARALAPPAAAAAATAHALAVADARLEQRDRGIAEGRQKKETRTHPAPPAPRAALRRGGTTRAVSSNLHGSGRGEDAGRIPSAGCQRGGGGGRWGAAAGGGRGRGAARHARPRALSPRRPAAGAHAPRCACVWHACFCLASVTPSASCRLPPPRPPRASSSCRPRPPRPRPWPPWPAPSREWPSSASGRRARRRTCRTPQRRRRPPA